MSFLGDSKTGEIGKIVSYHCTYGVGDLPLLVTRPELFANRFQIDFEPATLDCIEEWHFHKTHDGLEGRAPALNISFYARMDCARNHAN